MAETLLAMKSATWSFCLAGSYSADVITACMPLAAASFWIAWPMSLKKGLVEVSRETPIVPLDWVGALGAPGWEGPVLLWWPHPVRRIMAEAATSRSGRRVRRFRDMACRFMERVSSCLGWSS